MVHRELGRPILGAKFAALLDARGKGARFEASGACYVQGQAYVVCDNLTSIIRLQIAGDLSIETSERLPVAAYRKDADFEDIAFDADTGTFHVLIEGEEQCDGHACPVILDFSDEFQHFTRGEVEFTLSQPNKGFEGLTLRRVDGERALLALCEGNGCLGGDAGKQPGNGTIQVLRRKPGSTSWACGPSLLLPGTASFKDFAGMDLRGDRLALVSQSSAALWIGEFQPNSLQWRTPGTVYRFPRNAKGKKEFGNVEGVAWLDDNHVLVVSDRCKRHQPRRCKRRDQSVHIFRLPD